MQWIDLEPLSLEQELELERFRRAINDCEDLEDLQRLTVQLSDHCFRLQMMLRNAVHHIAQLEESEFNRDLL